jgi:hypothetical protein
MTVDELREQFKDVDGGTIVVMSKDSEGNGYSPLAEVESAFYYAETTWAGEIYYDEDYAEGIGAVPAVFFWPVN